METDVKSVRIKYAWWTSFCLAVVFVLSLLSVVLWSSFATPAQHITLEIRPLMPGGRTPDGFYVMRNLDSSGIDFKSIMLKNNILLITFDSREQSETAEKVLSQTLPPGCYVVEQYQETAEKRHKPTVGER